MGLELFLMAIALVFVIEGILPFLSPRLWRDAVAFAASQKDKVLRAMGFGAMVFGVCLLYLVHHV